MFTDNFQNIEVKDILESVSSEVRKLQDQGVNIIVASGHAGIDMDKEIAKLEGVDIVVGAHTETFMYTGKFIVYFSVASCIIYGPRMYSVISSELNIWVLRV